MLHKTQGIVLSVTKYNDKFSIAQVFTSDFGRTAYLLPNSKSKKRKINQALFFPLSIIDMEVEHFPLRKIHRLKDVQRQFPLYSINMNVVKLSISFFLSEFLTRVLQETNENRVIFSFIRQSVVTLEEKEKGLANFHLVFMFHLAEFLGVTPNLDNYKKGSFFDLLNGCYSNSKPLHNHYLGLQQSIYLDVFKRINYHNMHLYKLSQSDRNIIIKCMLDYYRMHIYDFPEIKSLEILRELH
jgi:DNA repair protein RecO (recombination protein O)